MFRLSEVFEGLAYGVGGALLGCPIGLALAAILIASFSA